MLRDGEKETKKVMTRWRGGGVNINGLRWYIRACAGGGKWTCM